MQAQRSNTSGQAVKATPESRSGIPNKKTKKTVSAAGVFKKRAAANSKNPSHGKKSDAHPLAQAFKDSSIAYRTHLYNRTTAKLNTTLDGLLSSLHAATLTAISLDAEPGGGASPPELTLAAKYDRATEKAFRPIGSYALLDVHGEENSANGDKKYTPLSEKMAAFEEEQDEGIAEMKTLEKQWEKVAAEIYKTGVACLGEEVMGAYLVVTETPAPESTTLVEEQQNPPQVPNKRVTFLEPRPEFSDILSGPSMYKKPIVPLPALPEDDIKGLEDAVAKLGVKQIDELRKIEAEQTKWWNKKCEQIAQTLRAD